MRRPQPVADHSGWTLVVDGVAYRLWRPQDGGSWRAEWAGPADSSGGSGGGHSPGAAMVAVGFPLNAIEAFETAVALDEPAGLDVLVDESWLEGAEVVLDDDGRPKVEIATCGVCGYQWNDALITSRTPAPAGRCPVEAQHPVPEASKLVTDTATADALLAAVVAAINKRGIAGDELAEAFDTLDRWLSAGKALPTDWAAVEGWPRR